MTELKAFTTIKLVPDDHTAIKAILKYYGKTISKEDLAGILKAQGRSIPPATSELFERSLSGICGFLADQVG